MVEEPGIVPEIGALHPWKPGIAVSGFESPILERQSHIPVVPSDSQGQKQYPLQFQLSPEHWRLDDPERHKIPVQRSFHHPYHHTSFSQEIEKTPGTHVVQPPGYHTDIEVPDSEIGKNVKIRETSRISDHTDDPETKGSRFVRDGPPPLVDSFGDPRWIVDRIVDHRDSKKKNSRLRNHRSNDREFLVHWLGYPSESDTWEPRLKLLEDVPDLVADYEASLHLVVAPEISQSDDIHEENDHNSSIDAEYPPTMEIGECFGPIGPNSNNSMSYSVDIHSQITRRNMADSRPDISHGPSPEGDSSHGYAVSPHDL